MPKFKISVDISDVRWVVDGITIDADAGVRAAREAIGKARSELERARHRAATASEQVNTTRIAVADGDAPASALEAAIAEQRTAAIMVPQYARRLAEAEAALAPAEVIARKALVRLAARRRDQLQEIASQVAPILNALKECEGALDEALEKATRTVNAFGTPMRGDVTAPLDWPGTLESDLALVNAIRRGPM